MFLERVVKHLVHEDLNWFLRGPLKDNYNGRRESLKCISKDVALMPAIDYILKTCIDSEINYPPATIEQWQLYFTELRSGDSISFQQLLLMYLRLDIAHYLDIRERESKAGRQTRAKDKAELSKLSNALARLEEVATNYDFPYSIIHLSAGLWALDNDDTNLMVLHLSHPTINLADHFEASKDIVRLLVGYLHSMGDSRMALYMSRLHHYDTFCQEQYDSMYAFLLIRSGQLVDALKYERSFKDNDNYCSEILQDFFESCMKCDVTKSLNTMNLTLEEEELVNHYLEIDSRPVTPSGMQTPTTKHVNFSLPNGTSSNSKPKQTPRNRNIQNLQRMPSFSDSPARNTRSASKKKTSKIPRAF